MEMVSEYFGKAVKFDWLGGNWDCEDCEAEEVEED